MEIDNCYNTDDPDREKRIPLTPQILRILQTKGMVDECASCNRYHIVKSFATEKDFRMADLYKYLGPMKAHKVPFQPQTQKAKGLIRLRDSNHDGWHYAVPEFKVYSARRIMSKNLMFKFCRPCPMTPRHGFVESRYVETRLEALRIARQTRKADPQGEIIVMPKIDAKLNAIWLPNSIVVGDGNDGATSGHDSQTYPTIGRIDDIVSISGAGITQAPYVEIVYGDYQPWFVQLRDGPQVPCDADYIPSTVKVGRVVEAGGGLLKWEMKVRQFTPDTVIWHPEGSLASHYAVHAILKGLPVVTSHRPEVGEQLTPNKHGERHIDKSKMLEGYKLGLTRQLSTNVDEYERMLDTMLVSCHHTTVWKGKFDRLLGYGMGSAVRLTVMAALGEWRYYAEDKEIKEQDRDDVYSDYLNQAEEALPEFISALRAFKTEDRPDEGVGGVQWYSACKHALVLHQALVDGKVEEALQSLNRLTNAVHNNSWLFNKFGSKDRLELAVKCPARILVDAIPTLHKLPKLAGKVKLVDYSEELKALVNTRVSYDAMRHDHKGNDVCPYCSMTTDECKCNGEVTPPKPPSWHPTYAKPTKQTTLDKPTITALHGKPHDELEDNTLFLQWKATDELGIHGTFVTVPPEVYAPISSAYKDEAQLEHSYYKDSSSKYVKFELGPKYISFKGKTVCTVNKLLEGFE